jgi:hypothetical protein
MITCPQCTLQNEEGAIFCDQCGATLTGASLAATAAATGASGDTCPVCGAVAMAGDAFCNECGAALGTRAPSPTPLVQTAAIPVLAAEPAHIVISNGQSVPLSGKASYLIGREDPMSGIYPEIDTTRSDGDVAGVSRRHAEIVQQSNQWFLQDLNSTNGTFVNNQRVSPHTRCLLHSGDQIRLGKWVATFQVQQIQ